MGKPADLPTWRHTPDGWTTADRGELAFALRAVIAGFDLRRFDDWLRDLEPCPARDELLALRAEAKGADRARMRRTLELMQRTRLLIEREAHLLPLARHGAKFPKGKPKGAAGPMRALIRAMLESKRCANLTARELWQACAELPERRRRGIDFGESDAWVSGHGNVSFRRFANIVSEERRARE
jgi:hypothetical protein